MKKSKLNSTDRSNKACQNLLAVNNKKAADISLLGTRSRISHLLFLSMFFVSNSMMLLNINYQYFTGKILWLVNKAMELLRHDALI